MDEREAVRDMLATGNKIRWTSYCIITVSVVAVTLQWLDLNQCLVVRSKGSTTELDTSPHYEASLPVTWRRDANGKSRAGELRLLQ